MLDNSFILAVSLSGETIYELAYVCNWKTLLKPKTVCCNVCGTDCKMGFNTF